MSVENEVQNIPVSTTQEATPSPNKTIELTCCICEVQLTADRTNLSCANDQCNQWTCSACIQTMFNVMLGQPATNYPLLCGACEHAFDTVQVDRMLAEDEHYEQYIACILPLFWSQDCLAENEQLARCTYSLPASFLVVRSRVCLMLSFPGPFCPYLEIHTTDRCSVDVLVCQHPSCGKRTCLICLHAIMSDSEEATHRHRCVELRSCKDMVDHAIELGCQQQCPHCQLMGLKDDGCTHMVCERCGLGWCYLCGMKEEECLVDEDTEPSLTAHNQDWEQHEGRCPMSLISIHELDERWPDNDRDCLEYFHRYRTLCQLYDVWKIIGDEKLEELNASFGLIDGSGYTIEEIKDYEDRILISYAGNTET